MSFQVHSKDLLGRTGRIRTKSGVFDTPHMFPVLDPLHQTIDPEFFDRIGIKAVMTNAYLMRRGLRHGVSLDVHDLLSFGQTVATDSGAYQILEFGKVGVKPDEIVDYQEQINTDIGVILDIPTGFRSDETRARWTVDETVRRADQALESIKRKDILWMGPVQGGIHLKEIERSAKEMSKRNFAIYALGSPTELMESQRYDILIEMVVAAKKNLPKNKPLHLFGAGHPVLFPFLVALGCDLFDSAAYALYARAGRYLTSDGTLLLPDMTEFYCGCPTCFDRSPAELMGTEPGERESLLARHNLWACFAELRRIREAIRKGRLWELLEIRARVHPSLADCFQRIRLHSGLLERATPAVKQRGIFFVGYSSWDRPEAVRYRSRLSSSIDEKGKVLLLLPGRWRRPFHEDPRYQTVSKSFDDHPAISICYYSLTWGPVPIELDETFPTAQAEGRDSEDTFQYQAKAELVADFVEKLRPRKMILVADGEYGQSVSAATLKRLGRRKVMLLRGDKMKPNAIIESIRKAVPVRS